MGATNLLKGLLSWFKTKVISVVQTQVASGLSQLFRGETFQRGLSGNRLENGQRDRTMRQLQNRCSGFGSLQAWQMMLARMLLHFYILVLTMLGKNGLTEHLATISKVSAGDSKMVDIVLHM